MILVFLLEYSGYKFQDKIKHLQQFFPRRDSNVTPYSSRSKSQNICKTRSEAFNSLKVLFLWSVKTIMDYW
jgi:hypothetical protein